MVREFGFSVSPGFETSVGVKLTKVSLLNGFIRPCINSLFSCGVCLCSFVTRHTDDEPLFCLVAVSIIVPLSETKVHCLCGESQGKKGTRHCKRTLNSLWIQGLRGYFLYNFFYLIHYYLFPMGNKCPGCVTITFVLLSGRIHILYH